MTPMIFDHPLIQHKISILRNKNTGTNEFRALIEEIATLMGYEALRDLPLEDVKVETPLETCMSPMIAGRKLAIVPILRAGLGMVDGVHSILPAAKVGHIGLYRDPETLTPVEYYCKVPKDLENTKVFVLDPMLATGKTAQAAVEFLKERGAKDVTVICVLAAPDGVKTVQSTFEDVDIYAAAYDTMLNDKGYIVPGLGDAGDRMFGTK